MRLIHCNILKFQDKPILRTCQKSALQHSLFWRYANFSKLMRTVHISMTSTLQCEYCHVMTDQTKILCTRAYRSLGRPRPRKGQPIFFLRVEPEDKILDCVYVKLFKQVLFLRKIFRYQIVCLVYWSRNDPKVAYYSTAGEQDKCKMYKCTKIYVFLLLRPEFVFS